MWSEKRWGVWKRLVEGLQIIFDMDGWVHLCGCRRGRCRNADIDR